MPFPPATLRVEILGLGDVLFCHATARNDTEIFTRATPEDRVLPMFEGIDAPLVVCGHTHMQFDRTIGRAGWLQSSRKCDQTAPFLRVSAQPEFVPRHGSLRHSIIPTSAPSLISMRLKDTTSSRCNMLKDATYGNW